MLLSCQNIRKSFGDKEIIKDASFHIEEREKTALIGANGAGKTTLLRMIVGELSSDGGRVILAKDREMGYLAQYQDLHDGATIHQQLLSTRQDILDMETNLRVLEQEMNSLSGDAPSTATPPLEDWMFSSYVTSAANSTPPLETLRIALSK